MHGTAEWSGGFGHGMFGQIFWVFLVVLVIALVVFALFPRK